MSEAIRSFAEAIEKMYRSFVLRDLLGFVVPGSIFLLSLWFLVGNPAQFFHCVSPSDSPRCLIMGMGTTPTVWQALVLLGISYLAGWVLQCVHFGIIDWIFQIVKYHRAASFLWPFFGGICLYVNAIVSYNTQGNKPISLITVGALSLDQNLKKIRGDKALSRLQISAPYTERISALMLMTGNLTFAGIPLLVVIASKLALCWWQTLIGAGVLLLLYLEYWRLFYARNLRYNLAIDAASQENERILQ